MGAADTIPGVSGGTIALITGIYENLLAAVKSVNAEALKNLLHLDFKAALAEIHFRFLAALLAGIALAVISLARLMHHLLLHYPELTSSLFFGLITASIWVVGRRVKSWHGGVFLSLLIAAASAYFVVGLVPAKTPETTAFIFLSGMIAICAMILPGLSGAFILLILGKYEFITATLKNPFDPANLAVIVVFAAGCGLGLAGFSRGLKYFLDTWRGPTLAFLTGLMVGSLRRVWPWKETVLERVNGEAMVADAYNVLPNGLDTGVLLGVGLMLVGALMVISLEKLTDTERGG
jgi:putative membrane protein